MIRLNDRRLSTIASIKKMRCVGGSSETEVKVGYFLVHESTTQWLRQNKRRVDAKAWRNFFDLLAADGLHTVICRDSSRESGRRCVNKGSGKTRSLSRASVLLFRRTSLQLWLLVLLRNRTQPQLLLIPTLARQTKHSTSRI